MVRRVANAVTRLQVGWVGVLRTAHWLDDDTFEISGWAFERGMDFHQSEPQIRVWLRSFGQPDLEAQVERVDEPRANTGIKDIELDYTAAGFIARFKLADLIRLGQVRRRAWRVVLSVSSGRRSMSGTFKDAPGSVRPNSCSPATLTGSRCCLVGGRAPGCRWWSPVRRPWPPAASWMDAG